MPWGSWESLEALSTHAAYRRPQQFVWRHVPGLGPTNGNHYTTEKPTAVTSLTWVRGSHTYKAGGQFRLDAFSNVQVVGNGSNGTGSFSFSGNETGLPYLQSTNVGGGTIGNPYASFLLGELTARVLVMYPIHSGAGMLSAYFGAGYVEGL